MLVIISYDLSASLRLILNEPETIGRSGAVGVLASDRDHHRGVVL
jgi:hypothetical protein